MPYTYRASAPKTLLNMTSPCLARKNLKRHWRNPPFDCCCWHPMPKKKLATTFDWGATHLRQTPCGGHHLYLLQPRLSQAGWRRHTTFDTVVCVNHLVTCKEPGCGWQTMANQRQSPLHFIKRQEKVSENLCEMKISIRLALPTVVLIHCLNKAGCIASYLKPVAIQEKTIKIPISQLRAQPPVAPLDLPATHQRLSREPLAL